MPTPLVGLLFLCFLTLDFSYPRATKGADVLVSVIEDALNLWIF